MGKDAESCDCVPWDGPERKLAAWTLTWTWNSPSLEEGSRAARTCGSASDSSHAFQMPSSRVPDYADHSHHLQLSFCRS